MLKTPKCHKITDTTEWSFKINIIENGMKKKACNKLKNEIDVFPNEK
jgi:hypothetical protein